MNKRDSQNVAYIVTGLLRDMTTEAPFAVGYRMGVRQMENAIRMLATGGGLSVDSIVRLARKNVTAKRYTAQFNSTDSVTKRRGRDDGNGCVE